MALDDTELNAFVGKVLGDLGGAVSVPLVRIGDALGLYRTIAQNGPATAEEVASAGCAERYVREWLSAQAASGYVTYAQGRFSLSDAQAAVFAEPDGPANLIGAFDIAAAMVENQAKVQAAFRTGRGVAWGEQAGCLFCAVARLFRPGYVNALVQDWLPALDGVVEKLTAGARVADVGCGHGVSTILMARAFPASDFVGYDFHLGSIAAATAHARAHGVENVRFEVATARDFPGEGYDLVTTSLEQEGRTQPCRQRAGQSRATREVSLRPRGPMRSGRPHAPVQRLALTMDIGYSPILWDIRSSTKQSCLPASGV